MATKGTVYNVKRVKQGNGEGKKFYLDIGKVIIHEGGKTGTLFLNAQDGDFVLFRQDPKGKSETAEEVDSPE